MSFKRKKLNRRSAKRIFNKGNKYDSRNVARSPMRGGIRM